LLGSSKTSHSIPGADDSDAAVPTSLNEVNDSIEADRDSKGAVAVLVSKGVCAVQVSCRELDSVLIVLLVVVVEAAGAGNGYEDDLSV